ncbi:hypothetical protein Fmac_029913 [Flemingia macrophylla]|uniref:FAF domain-containing protein n=1 Tax=Flemingia macrophylla TaxID=520843 RepID=A0ABD1LBR1_9FABA
MSASPLTGFLFSVAANWFGQCPPRPEILSRTSRHGATCTEAQTRTTTTLKFFFQQNPLQCDTQPDVGCGWSFLQTLSHTCKTEDQPYVHPAVKRSSSFLSEKSLEMCTESLGSETGSNGNESSDEVSLFSSKNTNASSTRHATTNCNNNLKRVNRACNLPPPLTTMNDLGGVQVRPRREGGRLILEAVASPSPHTYFHAERGDGRLRLCLVESYSASDSQKGVDDEKEECEEEEEEEEDLDSGAEDDEMGVKKLAIPSTCKESGKRDIFSDAFELPSVSLCL